MPSSTVIATRLTSRYSKIDFVEQQEERGTVFSPAQRYCNPVAIPDHDIFADTLRNPGLQILAKMIPAEMTALFPQVNHG